MTEKKKLTNYLQWHFFYTIHDVTTFISITKLKEQEINYRRVIWFNIYICTSSNKIPTVTFYVPNTCLEIQKATVTNVRNLKRYPEKRFVAVSKLLKLSVSQNLSFSPYFKDLIRLLGTRFNSYIKVQLRSENLLCVCT